MRTFRLVLPALLAIPAITFAAPVENVLSGCAEINKSGVYHLDRDLRGAAGASCLRIHDVSDVQLNCHGHSIMTDGSDLAALVVQTVKNFTIEACNLSQISGYSLFVGNSSDGIVTRNRIKDMVVSISDPKDTASVRVVGNRFEALGGLPDGTSPFGSDEVGVIPLQPGVNKIQAAALAVPNLAESSGPGTIAVQSSSLEPRVYPSPWRSNAHQALPIVFDQLPMGATVKIFTVSAHWVKTLHAADGRVEWNLKNDSGDAVASGFYLYLATDRAGWKKTGKFAIIR
jgi:hypothetical protein